MAKIGNWSEINAKCGTAGSPANKCPNVSEIQAAGARVERLICIKSITAA